MSNHYAVMGNPIAHSLSPLIHQLFAKQSGIQLNYEKIQIDERFFEQQVMAFFQSNGKGLNITSPCKQRAFAISQQATPRCLQAGAANTLWYNAGQLHADNTDGVGFIRDIGRYINIEGKKIILLGAGGAVRGILGLLSASNPIELVIANRTRVRAQCLQSDFPQITRISSFSELNDQYDVIINATSTGIESIPLPALISPTTFCYDLTYRATGLTPFIAQTRGLGCNAVDGLGMLVEQAAEAFSIWHGINPSTKPVLEYLRRKKL